MDRSGSDEICTISQVKPSTISELSLFDCQPLDKRKVLKRTGVTSRKGGDKMAKEQEGIFSMVTIKGKSLSKNAVPREELRPFEYDGVRRDLKTKRTYYKLERRSALKTVLEAGGGA